ncbi:transporter [Spiroplasma endosymbiont of Megaselia nigra]|uniref:transporter n=1 Tax=Spiroplasma endosymbiont of Megaselia nigra TaxID=2478537 RepID=UPI000F86C04A|nr:transporter [Spiroplasma endosymbiont of Megaselia nigra]RUO86451.1 transporter [Spiroplasma endosymbiont of Megaselia nigra]
MSTRRGIFSILIGAFTSLIGTCFQFTLMYLLIRSYGSQFNGFVKNSVAIVAFLGTVEGGLGATTVIFLVKPLLQKDWIKANEMVNTAKHQYKISGYIGIILLIAIAVGYSAYIYLFEKNFSILQNDETISYLLWKMILIVFIIGSKNLIALFWTAAYENLMQADQNNHLRRLILMICDLISYSIVFYLISIAVYPVFVFLIFLLYSVMKGSLVYLFIKLHYPWVRIARQRDNMQLVKSSNIVVFKNIGETLLINGDVIITALLLGLRISSTLSLYMTITVGVRSITMILINSFREFFATWTAKNGRVDWQSYMKFETYAFMIAGFLFVNQFILSPYFVTTLYAPQIIEQIRTSDSKLNPWTSQEREIFKSIFYQPTFSLLVALSSVFIVLAEPANVLVYAKANYKQTAIPTFIIGCLNIVFCFFSALLWRFGFNNLAAALYSILIITCLMSFLRFLYLWCYNWIFLTYNSNFKGVFRNWMILLVPMIIAILVNYLFLSKTHNPNQIYNIDLQPVWGWQKLLNFFFGLIFASLFVIFANSIFWAPGSVRGIFLRLPLVYKIWTKRQDKMRILRRKKYEDDFITLTEPEMPYQKMWEREETLRKNTKKIEKDEPNKEIYKLTG